MIENKTALIVLILCSDFVFGYNHTAYAQKNKPVKKSHFRTKRISAPKIKTGPKVNRLQKAKSAYKATTARKVTADQENNTFQRNWMITGYGANAYS